MLTALSACGLDHIQPEAHRDPKTIRTSAFVGGRFICKEATLQRIPLVKNAPDRLTSTTDHHSTLRSFVALRLFDLCLCWVPGFVSEHQQCYTTRSLYTMVRRNNSLQSMSFTRSAWSIFEDRAAHHLSRESSWWDIHTERSFDRSQRRQADKEILDSRQVSARCQQTMLGSPLSVLRSRWAGIQASCEGI